MFILLLFSISPFFFFALLFFFRFFFFKQKTAYEMRISDWSSDVCSSDLGASRHLLLRAVSDAVGGALYRRRHRARSCVTGAVRRYRRRRGGARQSRGRGADLADDRADAAQDRLRRIGIGAPALEGRRR